jgi:propanol-preferring alcohol dehydrogenase
VTFAPVGSVVVAALRSLAPGAAVAVNAIHLDEMPAFSYDLLWQERSIRSVANFTRADATEFLALAAEVPIRAQVQTFPLEAAGEALDKLAAGAISGSAVLVVSPAGGG